MRKFWNRFFLPFCILYSVVALIVADSDFKGLKRLIAEFGPARETRFGAASSRNVSQAFNAPILRPRSAAPIQISDDKLSSPSFVTSGSSANWMSSGSAATPRPIRFGSFGAWDAAITLGWSEMNGSPGSQSLQGNPQFGIRWPSPTVSTTATMAQRAARPQAPLATEWHWVGPNYPNPPVADGDFNVSQNWIDTAIVPNHGTPMAPDTAVFNGGSYTVTVTQAGDTVDTLSFAGSSGAMPILNLTQDFTAANLNGNGILIGAGTLTVGNYNGSAAFEVRGSKLIASSVTPGAFVNVTFDVVNNVTRGGTFILNSDATDFGARVVGDGSLLQINGNYTNASQGLTVLNGATFKSNNLLFGTDAMHRDETLTITGPSNLVDIANLAEINHGFLDIDLGGVLKTGGDLFLGGLTFGGTSTGTFGHVIGQGSAIMVGGDFVLGGNLDGGLSSLIVDQRGKITAAKATLAADTGTSAMLTLMHAAPNDANLEITTGMAIIGNFGAATVAVSQGGAIKLDSGTSLILGFGDQGNGHITLSDSNTLLNAPGVPITLARVSQSTGRIDLSGGAQLTAGDLTIAAGGRGIFTILGGTATTGSTFLASEATGNATGLLSGLTSSWNANGSLFVGQSGTGTLTVQNGGKLNVMNAVEIGFLPGSVGAMTVSGQSTQFTFGTSLDIGVQGSGTLNLQNGFALTQTANSPLLLGVMANSSGTLSLTTGASATFTIGTIGSEGMGFLTVDAATVQNNGQVVVGEKAGGSGSATVTGLNSKWTVDGSLVVGLSGAAGKPAVGGVTVSNGGTLQVNGASITLGQEANSVGALTIMDPASQVIGTGAANVEIGRHGSGILQILSGASFTMPSLTLGALDTGSGKVQVDGVQGNTPSTLNIGGALTIGGASKGELDVTNGGVVNTPGNVVIGRDPVSTGAATVDGASSKWNITTNTAPGNLVIGRAGQGTLTVSNQAQMEVGQLTIGENDQNRSATLSVLSGAKFTAAAVTVGDMLNSVGELDVTGDGSTFTATSVVAGNQGNGTIHLTSPAGAGSATTFTADSLELGAGGNGFGTAILDGGKAVMNVNELHVGLSLSGSGTLQLRNGAVLNVQNFGTIDVESGPGNPTNLIVSGTGSKLNAPDSLISLGAGSTNIVMSITDGAVVETGPANIGSTAPTTIVNLQGTAGSATWNVHGPMIVAAAPGVSQLNIGTNSSVNLDQFAGISVGSTNESGQLNVSGQGAVLNAPQGTFNLGTSAAASSAKVDSGGQILGLNQLNISAPNAASITTLDITGSGSRVETVNLSASTGTLVTVADGATLRVGGPATGNLTINGGTIDVSGPGAFMGVTTVLTDVGNGGVLSVRDQAEATTGGLLTIMSGGLVTIQDGKLTAGIALQDTPNALRVGVGGIVDNQAGGEIKANVDIQSGGLLTDDGTINGNVTVSRVGGTLLGTLVGNGTINGNLFNPDGSIKPGHSPGTLTVNGDYTQGNGGLLQIQIAGKDPVAFDHLNVTGHITLQVGSILEFDFLNGFAPKTGDTFAFLTGATSITGTFTNVQVNGLEPGFQYQLTPEGNGTLALIALNDGIAVPEPATILLFAIGLATLLSLQKDGRFSNRRLR